MLIYLAGFCALVLRQVLSEDDYLKSHHGQEYLDYCQRLRRYL